MVDDAEAERARRRVRAGLRRLRLYEGISDLAVVDRCARAENLRRHQRDYERADRARPLVAETPILAINNIEVIYDRVILVLKGVSLSVPQGGIVALLGANGAGKTTTLKAISNLLHAERGEVTKGSIEFLGDRVDKLSPNELVRR